MCLELAKHQIKTFRDPKGVIRNRKANEDRQCNNQKDNYDIQTRHRKLKIEQHKPH